MSIEPTSKKDIWNPYFYKHFQGYASILVMAKHFGQLSDWPSVENYNHFARLSNPTAHLFFKEQLKDMVYLWEIYHQQHIPTRVGCWHDFFNNLTWLAFPKLKGAIVHKMCQEPLTHQRTTLQNTLAHFDECGIVICASNEKIFELIKTFQWKALFCQPSNLLHCLPVLIGHGIMEKSLVPFIGMTAKAVFLPVDESFFKLTTVQQIAYVDEHMGTFILSNAFPHYPKALHPFPLLGWPGWYEPNKEAGFYDNDQYFRKGRKV
ncbi:MAG: DUF3025 domain-containing protein [Proteobacteria bacterium]|nr:DUF3025 domain-containing protein [Pseudomonadota bacterium]